MISPAPEILYRDGNLVALHKPSGLSLLADRSGAACLWDQLPDLLRAKPFQVHRIDKGTSGVLLIALNVETQRKLTRAFHDRTIRKFYLGWVNGHVASGGTIDLALKPGRKSRFRVAGQREDIRHTGTRWHLSDPTGEGHPSVTRVRPLLALGARSLLLLQPLTGRTHQLRVHLAWIGHPLLGDRLYGKPDSATQQSDRLQLHCHRLVVPGFGTFATHPCVGGYQNLFASDLPNA